MRLSGIFWLLWTLVALVMIFGPLVQRVIEVVRVPTEFP